MFKVLEDGISFAFINAFVHNYAPSWDVVILILTIIYSCIKIIDGIQSIRSKRKSNKDNSESK